MSYLNLFWVFFKLGLFTIGGGYAIVPLLKNELLNAGFMTLSETVDMVAISQMTPGPLAINAATFAGMRLHGLLGATVATVAVSLPCVIITIVVAKFFFAYNNNRNVQGTLAGIRPVIMSLILVSALTIGQETIFHDFTASPDWFSLVIAIAVFAVSLTVKKASPILLIIISGVFGAIFLR